jgi:hypothetical protein
VSKRIANIYILVEDVEQQNLVYRFLQKCGHHRRQFRQAPLTASQTGGSGEKYVRDNISKQVSALRASLSKKTSAILVVMIDADTNAPSARKQQLAQALQNEGIDSPRHGEPIAILIPKRHVETWIRAALGDPVDELTDYKKPRPTPHEIKQSAEQIYEWTRPNAVVPNNMPPSLTDSFPEWHKIPVP